MERERDIERWLKNQIETMGGLAYKFSSPGNDGVPDRIAIMPYGRVWFIELKTKQGQLTPIQVWQQNRLRKLGCMVRTVYGTNEAEWLIKEMATFAAGDKERRRKLDAVQTP